MLRKEIIHSKMEGHQQRLREVENQLNSPSIDRTSKNFIELMRELSHLSELSQVFQELTAVDNELKELNTLSAQDPEMAEMVEDEQQKLQKKITELTRHLTQLLIPPDPMDDRNIIMEIRAGTGGEEASLFAADLFRLYSRYAEKKKWKLEIMNTNTTELGGLREMVFSLSGKRAYANLKYESGVHRVQRIPITESSGRIHTSAVTVAVLPEVEEKEITVNPEDLRVDVYRSSGPGGQSVNTTDSAVRITHIPSGLVVICQDEKSQQKNKTKALRVLKARLYEKEQEAQRQERDEARKNQVGSGDRSERIRTYNFPQNRVTDHRCQLTLYQLDVVMEGELERVVDPLIASMQH